MTPMMTQYRNIKLKYPDCLLLFRLGDFYELFFEDAIVASNELDIALTGRDCGEKDRAPMCGVPHHAADGYVARLVEKGHRVAIAEQVEDPKQAKGIVKREVVRVITPGTVTDMQMLDESRNNYILCLFCRKGKCALAAADITTGAFLATQFTLGDDGAKSIIDEMARYYPAEILIDESFPYSAELEQIFGIKPLVVPTWTFGLAQAFKCLTSHFNILHLEAFGLMENSPELSTAGALLAYLQETQKNSLRQINTIKIYAPQRFMVLDKNSRQNLELTTPLRAWRGGKQHTLLNVLDHTCTAMGARILRSWIETPLMKITDIQRRLDSVEEFVNKAFLRAELRDLLKGIHDIERLLSRLVSPNGHARDMAALKASLIPLPQIHKKLAETSSELNLEMYQSFDDLSDIYQVIDEALVDNPPHSLREGGLIKLGHNPELDKLLQVSENGANWLTELETRERAKTGIKNLKVRYNKVFGYYIEITNANKHLAPDSYIRKQTLSNCERFTTDELDKLAVTILTTDEKRVELEYALFNALRQAVIYQVERVQHTAAIISGLDGLQSLAEVADRNRYCKPSISDGNTIYIREGRHPVLDNLAPFVPNDTSLDTANRRMAIITGPNMAGKSTYMRQVALITLMAQMGSFVPAEEAIIGVVDRIFTRVGASDDLASGQSTFMVEMTEVANILHNATRQSLIIMDEIGRGTSTYDGLSIAWAVMEYIADENCIGAKTLFATHYHELTAMEGRLPGIKNYSFAVGEQGDDILFLRKLVPGGADRSYGIQVARLAGLPASVVKRAHRVLKGLEQGNAGVDNEPDTTVR